MPIHAYAAPAAGAPLEPFEYEPGPLGPHEIEVAVTHCGICHSDLHLIDNDWGNTSYPLVPGHEVIGEVAAVGGVVAEHRIGDRVGIGWQCGSCGHCDFCIAGDEQFCMENQATCVGHPGGYADRLRADDRFAFSIPAPLASEDAAPLLCGGATVYTPLRHFGVRPDHRVGVIGIGGLGHLAVQFARAFGCEVTAFSSSPDKEAEARDLGAHHFVASRDPDALAGAANTLDFLLATVNVSLDWLAYLNVLRPKGYLCIVGAVPEPLTIPAFALLVGQKAVCGSPIAGRPTLREMLAFAARHGIGSHSEAIPMTQVNTALDRLRANRARFRIVLTR
jgi:uncharacterized zinc-type alcohol dehydrogenase-like protein